MEKSFKEIKTFNSMANLFLSEEGMDKTKLAYAINKVSKRLSKHLSDYNDELEDLRIDHAYTNDKGLLEYDSLPNGQQNYKYNKEGLKNLKKAQKKLSEDWDSKNLEFEPYYATELPEDLHQLYLEAFKGFVIE